MRPLQALPTLALVGLLIAGCGVARAAPEDEGTGEPPGVQTFQVPDRRHVEGTVDYPHNPPVGGPHNRMWQNCGFYSEPVTDENAVHSLEHGVVWITYAADLPDDQVATLRALAARPHVLASPYPNLPSSVVASAWGRQLQLDSATDSRLEDFIDAFVYGDQAPEPDAPCEGGIGDPA